MNTVCSEKPDEAREIFLNSFERGPKKSEPVKIEDALNRVLAGPVIAPEDSPPFTMSQIDGYAVFSEGTSGASENEPVSLKITGRIEMGKEPEGMAGCGVAMAIPTGGMLPRGADAVARREKCIETGNGTVKIISSISENENATFRGEDFKEGKEIMPAFSILGPHEIGLLAGFNVLKVEVSSKPVIAIFSTGDEIVEPGPKLEPGQIRDSNSYAMHALVEEGGGIPVRKGIIKDNFADFRKSLISALEEAELVIVTGGTAVGGKDFTAEVFDSMGSPGVLVNGVAQKGGRPVVLANIHGKPIVALPGHPPGALHWSKIFVKPAIERLLGIPPDWRKK